MHKIQVGKGYYSYIVGNHTVGIVSPTRVKHTATIVKVRNGLTGPTGIMNGLSDSRVTPEEIAAYITAQRLV